MTNKFTKNQNMASFVSADICYADGIITRKTIPFLLKKIWDILVELVVGFLIVLIALYFFGFKPFVVISGSMTPTLNVGDIIFIKANKSGTYEVGDIVTYQESTGSITTHRVVEVTIKDGVAGVITCGDANGGARDAFKPFSAVKGKTIFRLWKLGLVYDFVVNNLLLSFTLLGIAWASVSALKNEYEYYVRPATE